MLAATRRDDAAAGRPRATLWALGAARCEQSRAFGLLRDEFGARFARPCGGAAGAAACAARDFRFLFGARRVLLSAGSTFAFWPAFLAGAVPAEDGADALDARGAPAAYVAMIEGFERAPPPGAPRAGGGARSGDEDALGRMLAALAAHDAGVDTRTSSGACALLELAAAWRHEQLEACLRCGASAGVTTAAGDAGAGAAEGADEPDAPPREGLSALAPSEGLSALHVACLRLELVEAAGAAAGEAARPPTTHVDPLWSRRTSGRSRSQASVSTKAAVHASSTAATDRAPAARSRARTAGNLPCAACRAASQPPWPSNTPKRLTPSAPPSTMKWASSWSLRQPCISATAPRQVAPPPRWTRINSTGADEIWPMKQRGTARRHLRHRRDKGHKAFLQRKAAWNAPTDGEQGMSGRVQTARRRATLS